MTSYTVEPYNSAKHINHEAITAKGERVNQIKPFTFFQPDGDIEMIAGVVDNKAIRAWHAYTGESERTNGYALFAILGINTQSIIIVDDGT